MSEARFPTAVTGAALPSEAASEPDVKRIRAPRYDFARFEAKWRARWEEQKLYQVDLQQAQRPYYNLMMFPYPSAEGLHVGNFYSYVGSDLHGRLTAMQGHTVFEPIGFDAFGIHSENFAIKRGIHPQILTAHNVEHFREQQLKRMGNRFDWSHELNTTDPAYYRWTQWIFVQLFKGGLAERKAAPVNWCPKDKTVLADEQVINGHCERCDSIVERRWLEQWFLKLTNYAGRLLDNLDNLDWTERVKSIQRNWIGRSEGLEFQMEVAGKAGTFVEVYTTRPDTIFGMTFVALAPHHALVPEITAPAYQDQIMAYQETVNSLRTRQEQTMTGAFTGAYAIHPFSGERIPIWIGDFVLEGYGAGAIMGVPAHDERDLAFARQEQLPVRMVVQASADKMVDGSTLSEAFTQVGVLVDSGAYTGMPSVQAQGAICDWFEARQLGKRSVKYRLRDWLISRQRYWGPPIPIIYCPEHGAVPVPEDQLPVLLPDVEQWMPTGTGVSPLAAIETFVNTTCPVCGQPARRETDVSDNFLDSAWYYLRYPSSADQDYAWNPEMTRRWLPVDMCIGGADHSVLHLMYVRFIAMALHDLGLLEFSEPFRRFRANGTITRDGVKISKSRGNMINPDHYIEHLGADAFRMYLMFMGPYEADGDFSDRGIGGVVRFLDRTWQLVLQHQQSTARQKPLTRKERRTLHVTIKRVTEDMQAFKYNTAVATLMEYLNYLVRKAHTTDQEIETLLTLLAPIAPYITEELWEHTGHTSSIHTVSWPTYDPEAIQQDTLWLPIQVDGRVRDRIEVPADTPEATIKQQAISTPRIQSFIAGRPIQNIIYVSGRLINIVTR